MSLMVYANNISVTSPFPQGFEIGIMVVIFMATLSTYMMERKKIKWKELEDATSMYLCGEGEHIIRHNRSYSYKIWGKSRIITALRDENINMILHYIIIMIALIVVVLWISLRGY